MADKIIDLKVVDTTQHRDCAQSSWFELELVDFGSVGGGGDPVLQAIIVEKTYRFWQKYNCVCVSL